MNAAGGTGVDFGLNFRQQKTSAKMSAAMAIVMVFVGCCSNVVFLELLVK